MKSLPASSIVFLYAIWTKVIIDWVPSLPEMKLEPIKFCKFCKTVPKSFGLGGDVLVLVYVIPTPPGKNFDLGKSPIKQP
jgi:hypothetical protein